jgi:hypothetical protein
MRSERRASFETASFASSEAAERLNPSSFVMGGRGPAIPIGKARCLTVGITGTSPVTTKLDDYKAFGQLSE